MSSLLSIELSKRQRGDFQTPEPLARLIWDQLDTTKYDLVIEPTFGLGAFLTTIPPECPAQVVGWKIHHEYHAATTAHLADSQVRRFALRQGDVFDATFKNIEVPANASILIIGNPPYRQPALGDERWSRWCQHRAEGQSEDAPRPGCTDRQGQLRHR